MGSHRTITVLLVAAVLAGVASAHPLGFEERVALELKLQRLMDRHRIWPDGNSTRLPFDVRVTPADLRPRVERYLRRSAALEHVWGRSITVRDLQFELERIARHSRDPGLLNEMLWELGYDPILAAECIARPALAHRRFAELMEADPPVRGDSDIDRWLADLELPSGWRIPTPEGDTSLLRLGSRVGGFCRDGDAPDPRSGHTAVWTGVEAIVWGGYFNGQLSNGARYYPATDSWLEVNLQGAPSARSNHSAVWTGSTMIIWGGYFWNPSGTSLGDGRRYDPVSDTWLSVSDQGAPQSRFDHTAVWTGAEMIIWGGVNLNGSTYVLLDTGARYTPALDAWTPVSVQAATPSPRFGHRAVWTGSEMFVWGGASDKSAGLYDPQMDQWRPVDQGPYAPYGRVRSSVVWTGDRILVWGGSEGNVPTDTGAIYDPALNAWIPMSMVNAPSPREGQTTVWTGSEMVIWGGTYTDGTSFQYLDTGARYDPTTDLWRPLAMSSSTPTPRGGASGLWTGTEVMVWGGSGPGGAAGNGALYDPGIDAWRPVGAAFRPLAREYHTALWTGTELLVWGGDSGARVLGDGAQYEPAVDGWIPTPTTNAPAPRAHHTSTWTGSEMIVWGGEDDAGAAFASGSRYDPITQAWVDTAPAPLPDSRHASVWTGQELLAWGGGGSPGVAYTPTADSWRTFSSNGDPSLGEGFSAVWTGSEMIVWGGTTDSRGGRYDPVSDAWSPTSIGANVPIDRKDHSAVWTGSRMLIWGGYRKTGCPPCEAYLDTGRQYDPATDSWTFISNNTAPHRRSDAVAVWTGSKMIIWGGRDETQYLDSGAVYNPAVNQWGVMSTTGAPTARIHPRAAWTGSEMIVWGGRSQGAILDDGDLYDLVSNQWTGCPGFGSGAVIAGKFSSLGSAGATVRAYGAGGLLKTEIRDAFPPFTGDGAFPSGAEVALGAEDEIVVGPAPSSQIPPLIRGYSAYGVPIAGLEFLAYGTPGYGADVAAGKVDGHSGQFGGEAILTGPGPSPVFGPHVRGFRFDGASVVALGPVSFFAYGTLRYGVHPSAGELDVDGFDEILTGAGAGAVFGPHVRGFDYDGVAVAARPGVNFFAYGTPRFGVEIGGGDVDADGFDEILTGPGPSAAFGSHLRGFDVDGGVVSANGAINQFVFGGSFYGANVAAVDVSGDSYAEIVCGAGPDPSFGSRMATFDMSGGSLALVSDLTFDVYGLTYGVRVGGLTVR